MADRISTLPDSIICYILSFLPTRDSVATSILSKRWNPIWRSVPAFDFECGGGHGSHKPKRKRKRDNVKQTISRFAHSVNHFMDSRDPDQSLQRSRIGCCSSSCCPTELVTAAAGQGQHTRLEHLDISQPYVTDRLRTILLPSALLSKTLVELKLMRLHVKPFSSVHLPSLKILRLELILFSEYSLFAELLSGCPNLEDLTVMSPHFLGYQIQPEFKQLPKVVRAVVDKHKIPLELVYNVQFLRINWMECNVEGDWFPEFHNLSYIELGYVEIFNDKKRLEALKVLEHCSKLQNLVIDQQYAGKLSLAEFSFYDGRTRDWQNPLCVPRCISSHLKTCRINNYRGTETELEFAKYIMQNARLLHDMAISFCTSTEDWTKLHMIKQLSLCTRFSSTCQLSFN